MKNNDKGLSVVELIIAVAILAVMTTVLTGLVVTGMNFYKKQSADLSLQMQAQIVMAQIREYVTDATKVNAIPADKIEVGRVLSDKEEAAVTKNIKEYTHVFSLNGDVLNYQLTTTYNDGSITVENGEIASGVKEFEVEYNADDAKNVSLITVKLTLEKTFGSSKWHEEQNIALRNMLK